MSATHMPPAKPLVMSVVTFIGALAFGGASGYMQGMGRPWPAAGGIAVALVFVYFMAKAVRQMESWHGNPS